MSSIHLLSQILCTVKTGVCSNGKDNNISCVKSKLFLDEEMNVYWFGVELPVWAARLFCPVGGYHGPFSLQLEHCSHLWLRYRTLPPPTKMGPWTLRHMPLYSFTWLFTVFLSVYLFNGLLATVMESNGIFWCFVSLTLFFVFHLFVLTKSGCKWGAGQPVVLLGEVKPDVGSLSHISLNVQKYT